MKGYKIFNGDWTCREYQYVLGETARCEGIPVICRRGFHFCKTALDCLRYYPPASANRYAEVVATGIVVTERVPDVYKNKYATDELIVVREIPFQEFLDLCTGVRVSQEHNGNIIEETFVKGVKEGPTTIYRNGVKLDEVHYRDGELEGPYTTWHANGTVACRGAFRTGRRHGRFTHWNNAEEKLEESDYLDGTQTGLSITWNGDSTIEEKFLNNCLHGPRIVTHKNGTLISKENYHMGLRDGPRALCGRNGTSILEENYRKGVLDGLRTEYRRDGTKSSEATYHRGVLCGVRTEWWRDGSVTTTTYPPAASIPIADSDDDLY